MLGKGVEPMVRGWRFSLLPLWLVLPVLFAAAVAVPLCCLKMLRQESVTLRLRVVD